MSFRSVASPAFLVALGVLTVSAVGMTAALEAFRIYLQKLPIHPAPDPVTGLSPTLSSLPPETESWRRVGSDARLPADVQEQLGTANYLSRIYAEKHPADGDRPRHVELHVAYYTGMIDTVPHIPDRCFVGGGLSIVGGPWNVPVPLRTDGWVRDETAGGNEPVYTARLANHPYSPRPGIRVRLPRGLTPERPLELRVSEYHDPRTDQRLFAGYFFIANGGWVARAEEVRLLAFDLTDDYAYYLKVQVTSADVESPEELAALAGSLLDDLLGEVMRCVPDWVEVEQGRYPEDNPRRREAPPEA